MYFNTVSYLAFLLIVVGVYWIMPRAWRIWLLLAASVAFYGLWRVDFLLLIVFSAWIDYFFSLRIFSSHSALARKAYVVTSVSTNLGLLLYFKYTYFIADNIRAVSLAVGHAWTFDVGHIILPLGISFYTFLSISYTIDVYRKRFEPIRSFRDYLTYVMFWPHMIAGPILRAHELLPQLADTARRHDTAFLLEGARYVLYGLFLKVVLADNLAPFVDAAFNTEPARIGGIDVLTMAFAFGLQIYFDFAGYSMVAIGSALLVGVKFPENFNWPYFATSPRDFWKRWHITLSSWIRDYLYLPLCGATHRSESSGGIEINAPRESDRARIFAALFATWFIMGLWHGASWKFAFWGVWHAAFIFLYRLASPQLGRIPEAVRAFTGWGITLLVAMLGWIPFRAQDLPNALSLLGRLLDLGSYSRLGFRENFYLVTFMMFVGMLALGIFFRRVDIRQDSPLKAGVDVAFLSACMILVFIFLRPISQFIYFQF